MTKEEKDTLIKGIIEKHSEEYEYRDEVTCDVKAAMEELIDLLSPEWVSVEERQPELNQTILSYSEKEGVKQTKYITFQEGSQGFIDGKTDRWFQWISHNDFCFEHKATHWMPFTPPKH